MDIRLATAFPMGDCSRNPAQIASAATIAHQITMNGSIIAHSFGAHRIQISATNPWIARATYRSGRKGRRLTPDSASATPSSIVRYIGCAGRQAAQRPQEEHRPIADDDTQHADRQMTRSPGQREAGHRDGRQQSQRSGLADDAHIHGGVDRQIPRPKSGAEQSGTRRATEPSKCDLASSDEEASEHARQDAADRRDQIVNPALVIRELHEEAYANDDHDRTDPRDPVPPDHLFK